MDWKLAGATVATWRRSLTSQKFPFDRSAITDPSPSAKVIVHKFLTSYLQKPMTPLASRTYACCLKRANRIRFSWRHLAKAGAYTLQFTIINARQIRGLQESFGFPNCCFDSNSVFFFFEKWHRVLGTWQSHVRAINKVSLSQADLSTFWFDGFIFAQQIHDQAK